MTTFALIAGMMPVAIGMGEGGEFYRPMAVAIIGGVITSTFLTLLVIPSFYDSIELNSDRAKLKFEARAVMYKPIVAFLMTAGEFLATLTFLRFFYRVVLWFTGNYAPQEHPVERAARLHGFSIPDGFKPRPKPWQRKAGSEVEVYRNPATTPAVQPPLPMSGMQPVASS
jgi:hypothetical protein